MRRLLYMLFLALIYVAPYGQGSSCTIDAPCTLQSVMAANSVAAGETVYLLPGIYKGDFWSLVSGTQAQPITFRSVPGTKVVIDGSLRIDGSDTTWRGMEITYTGWTSRTLAISGSNPPGISQSGLTIYGARTRIERCYIHDTAFAIGYWSTATDSVIDGCLIANNGWIGPDRTHGHAIYAQNAIGTKTIRNTIILRQYADRGLNIYGSSAASLTGFDIISNTVTAIDSLIGGGSPSSRIHIAGNIFRGGIVDVGYWGVENNLDAVIENNYIGATLMTSGWQNLTVRGNTFEYAGDYARVHYPPSHARYDWDANSYRCTFGSCLAFTLYTTGNTRSFAAWQAETPYDANSTMIYNSAGVNRVIVNTSANQVAIFNYSNASSVTVDLAALHLTLGATYRIVNAQNVAETQSFIAGAPVSVPMTGWTVATPYAASAPLTQWDSRFAVFLVEPL